MNKVVAITTKYWKSLLGLNLFVLAATICTVILSPRVWTATAQMILPDTTSHLDANLGTLGTFTNGETDFSPQVNPLKVQASILTSNVLLEQVWAADPEQSKFPRLPGYSKLFKVAPQEQSTIIVLTVSGSSRELAFARANTLIQAYQQRLNKLRQTESTSRKQFSQKELEQARTTLSQAQLALTQFRQSTGLVNSEQQTQAIVTAVNTLTTMQAQSLAQSQASQSKVKVLSNRLSLTPVQAIRSLGLGENQDYQFVRNKLAEVEANLVQARVTYKDEHPRVQTLLSQRNELQRQLQKYVAQAAAGTRIDSTVATRDTEGRATLIQQLVLAESEASAQQRQANQLQSEIAKLNAALKLLPAHQARLLELQRHADVAEGVYKGLLAQVKQSSIDAFNSYPNVQVLDPPTVDPKPSSPKLSLVAINAFLASAIGSIALLLLLEGRNPLLTPKDLQAIKFPMVVSIPRFRHSGTKLQLGTETEVEFQRLASAISLQPLKDRRLLIASAIVGEGKTTVTHRLACALVDLGFRVLVVDGDFRQAELSRRLGYTQEPSVAKPQVRIQPNLDLMPMPRQGKIVELVTQGRFEQALAAVQSAGDYDYVLVDSAPVNLTSETALMATVIPNVLLVVRPGTSYRNAVSDSLAQLAQHHAQIVGLVVNGVETKSGSYPYQGNASLVNS